MQEEQRLEAPVNDRPSTPGVGASLPAVENGNNKIESENQVQPEKEEPPKVNKTTKKNDVKSQLAVPTSTTTSVKADKKLQSPVSKESAKAVKVNQSSADDETKQIKSPIKILKNSEGHYEVLRTSNNQSPEARSNATEKKTPSPEFSVVSIGEGPNSNGVKIKLKQCSPGGLSSKPKIVSNVLMRNGQTDKLLKSHEKSRQKELVEKQEKHKRKVTFVDKAANEKQNEENDTKAITEQSDKKEFLHGFRLTAKQPWNDKTSDKKDNKANPNPVSSSVKTTETAPLKSPRKEDKGEKKNNQDTIYSIKNKSPDKVSSLSTENSLSSKRLLNGIVKDLNTSDDSKIDVYAFPNEPPTLPAGAVKRKCPPGLPIFDIGRKRPHLQGQIRKKNPTTPVKIAKKQDNVLSVKKVQIKDTPPTGAVPLSCTVQPSTVQPSTVQSSTVQPSTVTKSPTPTISDNTRNLLDGCGLNIPASLSITLTAPKSPNHNTSSTDTNNLKDIQILSGKVNPSITLNDRSVDPRVLKALKTGQIRMPVASSRLKVKPVLERTQPVKRKKDETRDILDLSGTKTLDIHPLRIPQPVSKFKSKSSRNNPPTPPASSQVVTLTGGQKYYRAPPGSLTPAVHRVADYPQTPPSRAPVYAPCFSSSISSSRSNNNISSVFPSLQSLYALSQAPNLQQFQMDNRLRLPQPESTTSGPNKSHLAAQCAPLKPARSSFASLAVPIVKQAPTFRGLTFTPVNIQINEPIKKSSPKELATNNENPNSSLEKPLGNNTSNEKTVEKLSQSSSSPISSNLKQDASASNSVDSNLQEAASPRVSSTVSPSPPPPTPLNNSSINSTNADEVSSGTCNKSGSTNKSTCKSGSEVTSTKSPESPDSSSIVNENSNSASSVPAGDQVQTPLKEDKVSKNGIEKQVSKKNEEITVVELGDKKVDNIKVDVDQMSPEVFQKRFLAAFPSNEWSNNPIAAKHLGNLLKSLTSMQNEDKNDKKKTQSKNTKEIISSKCVKDILPKTNVEVTD